MTYPVQPKGSPAVSPSSQMKKPVQRPTAQLRDKEKSVSQPTIADQLARHTQRLSVNRYSTDEGCSHISIDQEKAKATHCGSVLVKVCPAHVYSMDDDGNIHSDFAACLECGTCRAVAPPGVLTWHYPRGGKGIEFRHG